MTKCQALSNTILALFTNSTEEAQRKKLQHYTLQMRREILCRVYCMCTNTNTDISFTSLTLMKCSLSYPFFICILHKGLALWQVKLPPATWTSHLTACSCTGCSTCSWPEKSSERWRNCLSPCQPCDRCGWNSWFQPGSALGVTDTWQWTRRWKSIVLCLFPHLTLIKKEIYLHKKNKKKMNTEYVIYPQGQEQVRRSQFLWMDIDTFWMKMEKYIWT